MVYTPDKPDLFSRICAYFARRNLNILEAKIHTTSHQYALDTFIVTGDFISGNRRDIITRIEQELAQTLSLQSPLPVPERGRPSRESRVFPLAPDVNLQADAGGNRYILSVTANDRKGLLYDISRVLGEHHVNLHMAKITTLGERAEDIFLIEGAFLQSEKNRIHFETALIDALSI
jgi:[protein-PII] uridylyltransferase